MKSLNINNLIEILELEVEFQVSRSSGPGGQKVNKTSSKVSLFWKIDDSELLDAASHRRFLAKNKNDMTKEGLYTTSSETSRSQLKNKNECLQKLALLIQQASVKPKPRIKTKPTKSSKEKRLKEKKAKSEKKQWRKKIY